MRSFHRSPDDETRRRPTVLAVWLFLLVPSLLHAGPPPEVDRWKWGPGANTWRQSVAWRDLPLRGPLVQLELLNRDHLSGELLRLTDKSVEFRTFGGCTVQFSRSALLGLLQSAEWDVIEFRRDLCGTSASPCQFARLPPRGRLTGWLQRAASDDAALCQISFGSWSYRVYNEMLPGESSRLKTPQRLVLNWRDGRVSLFLAGQFIRDEAIPSVAETLAIVPAEGVELRNAVLARPRTTGVAEPRPREIPLLGLSEGGELAAERVQLVDSELEIEADGAATRWLWSEWKAVTWPGPRQAVPARPVTGWLVELDLQPLAESPGETPDRLTGAITGADESGLRLAHPLLGHVPIPWTAVRQLSLRGWGTATPLRLGPVHLGDEIRPDLRSPVPVGIQWEGQFRGSAGWSPRVWLELEQADLEPSGPATPPGSPFLADLRTGRLVTELSMNGRELGALNRHLRWKAEAGEPARLAIPLPSFTLRPGENTWRLTERPRGPSGGYDDWELWNLILYRTWP